VTVYAHALPDREIERREQLGTLFSEKVKHNGPSGITLRRAAYLTQ